MGIKYIWFSDFPCFKGELASFSWTYPQIRLGSSLIAFRRCSSRLWSEKKLTLKEPIRNQSKPSQILISCEKRGKIHVVTRGSLREASQAVEMHHCFDNRLSTLDIWESSILLLLYPTNSTGVLENFGLNLLKILGSFYIYTVEWNVLRTLISCSLLTIQIRSRRRKAWTEGLYMFWSSALSEAYWKTFHTFLWKIIFYFIESK